MQRRRYTSNDQPIWEGFVRSAVPVGDGIALVRVSCSIDRSRQRPPPHDTVFAFRGQTAARPLPGR